MKRNIFRGVLEASLELIIIATIGGVIMMDNLYIPFSSNIPSVNIPISQKTRGRSFIVRRNAGSAFVYRDLDNDGFLDEGTYYGVFGGRQGFKSSCLIKPVPSKIQEEYSRYLASANVGGN